MYVLGRILSFILAMISLVLFSILCLSLFSSDFYSKHHQLRVLNFKFHFNLLKSITFFSICEKYDKLFHTKMFQKFDPRSLKTLNFTLQLRNVKLLSIQLASFLLNTLKPHWKHCGMINQAKDSISTLNQDKRKYSVLNIIHTYTFQHEQPHWILSFLFYVQCIIYTVILSINGYMETKQDRK